jgi:hypothetical protein
VAVAATSSPAPRVENAETAPLASSPATAITLGSPAIACSPRSSPLARSLPPANTIAVPSPPRPFATAPATAADQPASTGLPAKSAAPAATLHEAFTTSETPAA